MIFVDFVGKSCGKTQVRLLQNALTFEVKRPYVFLQTHLRFGRGGKSYGHQNELCKIERRQKCCCGLFISELNENGLSCERKTKCDIALQTLYV